jgi:hypothetical protein
MSRRTRVSLPEKLIPAIAAFVASSETIDADRAAMEFDPRGDAIHEATFRMAALREVLAECQERFPAEPFADFAAAAGLLERALLKIMLYPSLDPTELMDQARVVEGDLLTKLVNHLDTSHGTEIMSTLGAEPARGSRPPRRRR